MLMQQVLATGCQDSAAVSKHEMRMEHDANQRWIYMFTVHDASLMPT